MADLENMQHSISEIFRNARSDIMAEDSDSESVWTDLESEEEEEDEEDEVYEEEDEEDDVLRAHHETLASPCFELPNQIEPCAICFEDIKMINMMVTRCGHIFHASCMCVAISTKPNCPMCRTELVCSHTEKKILEEEEVEVSWTIDRTPAFV